MAQPNTLSKEQLAAVKWDSAPAIDPSKVAWDDETPVTAGDRVQAAEGGLLSGAAYGLASIPDAVPNIYQLAKAGAGTAWHAATGKDIPEWLQPGQTSPIGHWLTEQMDKSPITTTQPARPDDAASRYLSAGASGIGGAMAGGSGGALRALIPAAAGGLAAQGATDAGGGPAAQIAASLLASRATNAVTGRPGTPKANDAKTQAVLDGQQIGLKFPPATTNPGAVNNTLENVAGKTAVAQHYAVENQRATNEAGRRDMRLPAGNGEAITDGELAQAKLNAAPGYQGLDQVPRIPLDNQFRLDIIRAMGRDSRSGNVAPSLRNNEVRQLGQELRANAEVSGASVKDALRDIREKAGTAYRQGNYKEGDAYKAYGKALEDGLERGLGRVAQQSGNPLIANIISNYKDSRRQYAIINSVEDNRNLSTGNLVARKLMQAKQRGDYLSGDMLTVAKAAGQAGRTEAFAEPTKTAGNHLGMWGTIFGAKELTEHVPTLPGKLAVGTLAFAARPAVRGYLGSASGQARAVARNSKGMAPAALTAALAEASRQKGEQ